MSSPSSQTSSGWSGDLLAAGLAGLWLVLWRAAFGVPWGLAPITDDPAPVNPGILYNPGDTWSYLSWVQQYLRGAAQAGLLYTTEEHASLLWLFPLWLVARIAALTGLPPLGIYNVVGAIAAVGAVVAFRRAARSLGLDASARNWATFALLLGTGGSWLAQVAKKAGIGHGSAAPELFFLDLFPSTSVLVYAYHAIGLALLAAVWWFAAETENRIVAGRPWARWAVALLAAGVLLAFSRPYEPLAFAAVWAAKSLVLLIRRGSDAVAWRATLLVGLLLAAALAPGLGWTAWVSTRPVWSNFAGESMQLGPHLRLVHWTLALSGWLVLAGVGAFAAWQRDARRALLPVAAAALFLALLLGFGSGQAKLASGLMLGPALLAGWALARLHASAISRARRIGPFISGGLAAGLLGVPGFFLAVLAIRLAPSAELPADFIVLAHEIPGLPQTHPLTLADTATAEVLPGLVGARVWAGHFSLTNRYWEKRARLVAAGLDPAKPAAEPRKISDALAVLLAETSFECALIDQRCSEALAVLRSSGWRELRSSSGHVLLQPPGRP